ncbi:MAG: beta strand repeat-containing protein [Phycisphaerae bacterium]
MAGRLFGQSARKSRVSGNGSRNYLDALETRVLLSSTLLGNWTFDAAGRSGSMRLTEIGAIQTGQWNTFNGTKTLVSAPGILAKPADSFSFTDLQSSFPVTIGKVSGDNFPWAGVADPANDAIAFSDVGLANGVPVGVAGLNFAVLNSANNYSAGDLVGTWMFAAEKYRATVNINRAGAISGSLTFNNGNTVSVTGSAVIRQNGTGSLTLSNGETLVFTMNNSKDTITANTQDFGNNISVSEFLIGVRDTSPANFTRDTIRGGWSLNANGLLGHLSLGLGSNPNGITGLVNSNGVYVTASGSYLVNADGSLEMELVFSNGVRETLSGRIAAGQGTILLDTPTGAGGVTVLTSDVGRPARNPVVDVSGDMALYGIDKTGSLTLDGNGNVTTGSFTQRSVLQVVSSGGGSVYNVVPGTVNLSVTTQPNGTGVATVTNFAGGLNSRGDLLALNEFTTTAFSTQPAGLDLLVAHTGTFTNANFAGVWNIDAEDFRGTVAFNRAGAVTGGSITLNDGQVQALTGGGVTVNATGVGTVNLVTAASTVSLGITMASGKDIAIGNSSTGGELTVMVKSSGQYAPTEIGGTNWRWAGVGSSGNLRFQPNNVVRGKVTIATGQILNVAGTYRLANDGSIEVDLTFNNGTSQKLIGRINGARNAIALDTTGGPGASENSQLVVLVNDTNHAPLENASGVLPVAAHQRTATQITYQQLLQTTGAIDREGSTIYFVVNSLGSGAQLTITSAGATSRVIPGFTAVAPGDTLTYTAPAGANGKTLAFTVTASDGVLSAGNPSQVFAMVSPIPSVGVTASRPTVDEGQAGGPGAATSIVITRSGAATTSAVTVHLAITGTATLGTHYQLKLPNGTAINTLTPTVTIPAGASSLALTLTAISDHAIDPTRTVTVHVIVDPNGTSPAYQVAANRVTTVSVLDGAPAVTVRTAQGTSRQGQNGEFIISRSNVSDGPLTVNFNTTTTVGTGTPAVQGTDYVLKDAAGHTLTGSITLAAGQKEAAVFVVPVANGKHDVTLSATLAVAQSNTYRATTPTIALVEIVEPQVAVS